jgi:hypothetical protein
VTVLQAQTNLWQNSGNIGIGTTSPAAPLHVYSPGEPQVRLQSSGRQWAILTNPYWANNGFSIYDITADCARLHIGATGNVGINTIAPRFNLEVAGMLDARGIISESVGGMSLQYQSYAQAGCVGYEIKRELNNNAVWGIFMPSNSTDLRFGLSYIGGGDMLTLQQTGNIGIGTSAPEQKLQVVGGRFQVNTAASWDNFQIYTDGTHSYLEANGDEDGLFIKSNTGQKVIFPTANVGIGTSNPTEKLSVNGKIRAKEVIVDTNWSDYVFAKNYKLASLAEVEQHIQTQGHLPGVPSAQEVADNGVSVGDMQAVLLAKIEELTLHVIKQEKRLDTQAAEIAALKAENIQLKAQTK